MRIEDIDKNFKVEANKIPPEVEWHDPRNAPFGLCGVFYDEKRERYQRLPYEIELLLRLSPRTKYSSSPSVIGSDAIPAYFITSFP